jgi:hypothetical protein
MSALSALLAAIEVGINISADEGDLILEAAQPPSRILKGCNKTDIPRLLKFDKSK